MHNLADQPVILAELICCLILMTAHKHTMTGGLQMPSSWLVTGRYLYITRPFGEATFFHVTMQSTEMSLLRMLCICD